MNKKNNQSGFTLVELAIVLVIIGLIVGGVLAGQDLIKAAQVRNAQSQIDKINTAATAFQLKYNGLPGDLPQTAAVATGLFTALTLNSNPGQGLRDGNGLVEGLGGTSSTPLIGGEVDAFFSDLSLAGLLANSPNAYGTVMGTAGAAITAATSAPAITAANASTYFPVTKLRNSAEIAVVNFQGRNNFIIGSIVAAASGTPNIGNGITPVEAAAFEAKFDDGFPLTGGVQVPLANLTGLTAIPAAPTTATCLTAAASPGAYNVATAGPTAGGNNVNCVIAVKASF